MGMGSVWWSTLCFWVLGVEVFLYMISSKSNSYSLISLSNGTSWVMRIHVWDLPNDFDIGSLENKISKNCRTIEQRHKNNHRKPQDSSRRSFPLVQRVTLPSPPVRPIAQAIISYLDR